MKPTQVNLAEAKAQLSELTERAAAGEEVIITKRGRAIARLSSAERPRQAIDRDALKRLTNSQAKQKESTANFIRRVRQETRY